MAHPLTCFLFGATLLAFSSAACAEPFYKDSDMPGYWWNKDPAENESAPEQKPQPTPETKLPDKRDAKDAKKEPRFPKMSDYTTQELYDMYPDQFSELLVDFKKEAVQHPTVDNVSSYMRMQDIARRKSEAFENAWQLSLLQHPELSLEKDYPTSGPGKEASNSIANTAIDQMVHNAPRNFGLIYFYQDGCKYCEAEAKVLSYIITRGWQVKKINIKEHPDQAAQFNVTVTPTLLLVKQGDQRFLPMSYGVITYTDLAQKIYNGVEYLNGEISPEQFGMREDQRGGGFDPLAPLK